MLSYNNSGPAAGGKEEHVKNMRFPKVSPLDDAEGFKPGNLSGQVGFMDHLNDLGYVFICLRHLLLEGPFPSGLYEDPFIL